MRRVADELGLVPTGGSDYHGDTGTYAEAHAQLWVPPAVGERSAPALGSEPAPVEPTTDPTAR